MPASRDLKGRHMSDKKSVPGYIWMLAGLVIGLFASFLMYLDKQPAEEVSFTEAVKQELNKAREQQKLEVKTQQKDLSTNNKGETENKKPRFEFYTILSELEVFVPEPEVDNIKNNSSNKQQQNIETSAGKKYLLQAGSFKSKQDAERLKASLALLGVMSSIQSVNINSDKWHRVRIGPFSNPNLLRETLSTLKQNNIHAMTMELK
ncbi:MAG: SPOR domain-containing protein [endosymbiont of Galathealinum brachiosum]|uniref:SPOR domain-containing protein n=1 Tax=endosymbiont of Galathealinum brachiosum TaxID=2200906 RepID=A0A370DDB1_9GAMM|nr:MAG: SPOR domain-containing protein [endosymbiont of Galathealinum brachiosum]